MTLIERSVIRDPQSAVDNLRLRFSQAIVTVGLLFLALQLIQQSVTDEPVPSYLYFFLVLFGGVWLLILQRRAVNIITNILLLSLLLGAMLLQSRTAILGVSAVMLISAPLFGSPFTYYFVFVVMVIRTITYEVPFLDANYDFFISLFPYIIVLLLISTFVRVFRVALQEFVTNSRRTSDLLSASSTIGQAIGQYLDLPTLLSHSVDIIRDRLVFSHVQIFLADESNEFAVLTASTGDVGAQLLKEKQRFPILTNNLIGRAIQAGEPVKNDIGSREQFVFAERLPDTRSELVVPIIEGERIIGALDVHSRYELFSKNDEQALEIMANQLATAIRNARLFEQQAQTIRENKRLFLESETNLREIERLNRQLTKQAWDEYLRGRGVVTGVTWSHREFRPGAEWTAQMAQAAQRRRVMTQKDDVNNKRIIAVPVELRGEVVGAIEIETSDNALVSDTVDMLQAISQRLAISLDNARLFEETQEATAQEQRINEIVSGYQSAETIEDLLQITLQGLAEALGAEQGAIRLGSVTDATKGAHANGSNGDSR